MPRDLAALREDTLRGSPQLTKSPEEVEDRSPAMDAGDEDNMFRSIAARHAGLNSERDKLHPYTQTLSLSDIESCILLEEAAFPPNERCTREKVRRASTHSCSTTRLHGTFVLHCFGGMCWHLRSYICRSCQPQSGFAIKAKIGARQVSRRVGSCYSDTQVCAQHCMPCIGRSTNREYMYPVMR